MKRLLYVIISILFVSCANRQTTAQLEKADTLMASHLDSAYAILKAINPGDIRGSEQNAYYALLYTQAQYKKYILIHSDSLINIAANYYEANPKGDKLTRAYMYKGGVLSDLNYNKLALDCYKQAEQVANKTDYLTLGLINTRMGELYQKTFIANDEHIEKYKKALKYFRLLNNEDFIHPVLTVIGQLYRIENRDSAYYYLNNALNLATQCNDSLAIFDNKMMLAEIYSLDKNYRKSKSATLNIIQHCKNPLILQNAYYCLVRSYANLNNIDSAIYYFNRIDTNGLTAEDSVSYLLSKADIAKAQHNYKNVFEYDEESDLIANLILKNSYKQDLYSEEKQFDNRAANERAERYKLQVTMRNYLVLSICLVVTVFIILSIAYWKRKKRHVEQQLSFIEQLQTDLKFQEANTQNVLQQNLATISTLNKSIEERAAIEQSLKAIVGDRMKLTRKLITAKYEYEGYPEKFMHKFTDLMSVNKKSKEDCDNIIKIANQLNNDIIDYVADLNPNIKYNNKLLLSLVCLQFTNIEMKVFLKLSNLDAVYSMKYRLGQKLETSSLESYIDEIRLRLTELSLPK